MKYINASLGIICITIMETIALLHGINGTLMSLSFGAICTIVGYGVGKKTDNT